MTTPLRVAIATYGPEQFASLDASVRALGHEPVVHVVSRSLRQSGDVDQDMTEAIAEVVRRIPPDRDLLLPANSAGLSRQLLAYQPDVILVFGFNWRIPDELLARPPYGVLNIHPSLLPRHRGPSPVPWAIRSGDPCFGVTIHRMTHEIDAGPILAQSDPLPIPEEVTHAQVWSAVARVLPELVATAVEAVLKGSPGRPQDEALATYAGYPSPDWYEVNWTDGGADLHHQLRLLRFLNGGKGVPVELDGRKVRIDRTSLEPAEGIDVLTGDGHLWITQWEDVTQEDSGG